jgi:spoIIIJ-associated protein
MEWVETTGRSIDEAKSKALDQLGVAEDDAEFDVLDEPRAGLFGRLRGEARVRARVRPTQPRPKPDRRDRKKKSDDGASKSGAMVTTDEASDGSGDGAEQRPARSRSAAGTRGGRGKGAAGGSPAASIESNRVDLADADSAEGAHGADSRPPSRSRARTTSQDIQKENVVDAQQVGDEAQRFVQGLVDAFGVIGTTVVRREGDDIEVVVEGTDLGLLVGPRGATLQAVQELTRVASQRRLGDHETRLRVDIAGYRERRREALGRFAQQVAEQVIAEGTPKRLEPMSSADRKIIHDVLAEVDGVVTRSEGDDPARCVVIEPANA